MLMPGGLADHGQIPSLSCTVIDLAEICEVPDAARGELACDAGWERRWEASWQCESVRVDRPVSDLGMIIAEGCRPWRYFTWRAGQRHRPGLQFLVSTGRHHGFESMEEQRFLLALDFAGGVAGVVSQPFRPRAETAAGWREHIPDFLAVTGSGVLLADVRPRDLIRDEDRVLFAASAEAALAAGWRYSVICGWRSQVMATLDMLSSQRRPLADPPRLAPQVLAAAGTGPLTFDDLARATSCPAVARAHALPGLAPPARHRPGPVADRELRGVARLPGGCVMTGLVKLAAGARLMLDGAEWTVEECRPQSGQVVLRGAGGQRRPVTIRELVNAPGFRPVPAGPPGRVAAGLEDLTDDQREQLHLRVAHVLEAETGFRSGSPLLALAGEPRPEYDPDATTPAQRRAAKAAGEVTALTVAGLAGRYPSAGLSYLGRERQPHGIFIKESWVLSRSTRYCPQCLAGDPDSPVQQQLGGAWDKLWRLPVIFGCPRHQRLLEHACPACRQPAHLRDTHGGGLPSLIPLPAHAAIHPAACRHPQPAGGTARRRQLRPCGHPLAEAHAIPWPKMPDGLRQVLQFQQHLLELLDPSGPEVTASGSEQATPAEYFTDLRIIACLITCSWPAARDLATLPGQAALISQRVAAARRQANATAEDRAQHRQIAYYDTPPLEAATCAALLTLVGDILASTSPGSLSQAVRHLIGPVAAPAFQRWAKWFLAGDGYCSPALRAATGPAVGALHVIR
jgi:hypothetical protein